MLTAQEFCRPNVVTATQSETLSELAERMRDAHVGCAIVVDALEPHARRPLGVVTDRDIVTRGLTAGSDPRRLRVGDVMSAPVIHVLDSHSLAEVLKRMRAAGVRRVPVLDQRGAMKGLIAFDDILDFLQEELSDVGTLLAHERMREERERVGRELARQQRVPD